MSYKFEDIQKGDTIVWQYKSSILISYIEGIAGNQNLKCIPLNYTITSSWLYHSINKLILRNSIVKIHDIIKSNDSQTLAKEKYPEYFI